MSRIEFKLCQKKKTNAKNFKIRSPYSKKKMNGVPFKIERQFFLQRNTERLFNYTLSIV